MAAASLAPRMTAGSVTLAVVYLKAVRGRTTTAAGTSGETMQRLRSKDETDNPKGRASNRVYYSSFFVTCTRVELDGLVVWIASHVLITGGCAYGWLLPPKKPSLDLCTFAEGRASYCTFPSSLFFAVGETVEEKAR